MLQLEGYWWIVTISTFKTELIGIMFYWNWRLIVMHFINNCFDYVELWTRIFTMTWSVCLVITNGININKYIHIYSSKALTVKSVFVWIKKTLHERFNIMIEQSIFAHWISKRLLPSHTKMLIPLIPCYNGVSWS